MCAVKVALNFLPIQLGGFIEDLCFRLGLLVTTRVSYLTVFQDSGLGGRMYRILVQSAHPFSPRFGTEVPEFCEILIC